MAASLEQNRPTIIGGIHVKEKREQPQRRHNIGGAPIATS